MVPGKAVITSEDIRKAFSGFLKPGEAGPRHHKRREHVGSKTQPVRPSSSNRHNTELLDDERSEERRVGKECRSRWSPDHANTKSTVSARASAVALELYRVRED